MRKKSVVAKEEQLVEYQKTIRSLEQQVAEANNC